MGWSPWMNTRKTRSHKLAGIHLCAAWQQLQCHEWLPHSLVCESFRGAEPHLIPSASPMVTMICAVAIHNPPEDPRSETDPSCFPVQWWGASASPVVKVGDPTSAYLSFYSMPPSGSTGVVEDEEPLKVAVRFNLETTSRLFPAEQLL